jgi:dipeptidyl aminopeptidase/acylaminoacyl peptidase
MANRFPRVRNHKSLTTSLTSIVVLTFLSGSIPTITSAQQSKRPFTVADEIELTLFGDPHVGAVQVHFSPDGNYFAAYTERGRLDLNLVEDSLRFYRSQDVKDFLEDSGVSRPPSPLWIVNRSGNEGPIINAWRWLPDSSGVSYLERRSGGNYRLVLTNLSKKTIEPLTSDGESVRTFDVRDRLHFVYTATDPAEREKRQTERQAPAIVGTGRSLLQLLFPDEANRDYDLWAVVGGKRFEVKNDGAPLSAEYSDLALWGLALSPDGRSLVTELKVSEVPLFWETLYPPPFASDPRRIRTGSSLHQYVRIDLQTGSVRTLTDAPASDDVGSWAWVEAGPSWSSDGEAVLLPGTFLYSRERVPSRPCVAVVDLRSNIRTCVEVLRGHTETGVEEGYHGVKDVRFIDGDKHRVMVSFWGRPDYWVGNTEYRSTADATWRVVRQSKGNSDVSNNGLEVTVKQGLNEPPLLFVTKSSISRVIWDPNPQIEGIALGQASIYAWKDGEGREWRGALYKPSNYNPARRYPLVIQTHHFFESEFRPSGMFPTAFAARALAATGIVVLQVQDLVCMTSTIREGPCAVSGYESAASQLVSEGVVDPEKIGIIGFSRTCFYVMQTLTTGSLHLKAASITDGVMASYLEYMFFDQVRETFESMIGAKPFGEGLQQWLKQSPGFNLDKITTPLLVNAEGPTSLLYMGGPFAGLRYLHKPVDLIMLNTDEHVLTNPAVRMASQGGSVDWFRFWLKDEEDPSPAKAEQYKRWRELRKMQQENENELATPRAASN